MLNFTKPFHDTSNVVATYSSFGDPASWLLGVLGCRILMSFLVRYSSTDQRISAHLASARVFRRWNSWRSTKPTACWIWVPCLQVNGRSRWQLGRSAHSDSEGSCTGQNSVSNTCITADYQSLYFLLMRYQALRAVHYQFWTISPSPWNSMEWQLHHGPSFFCLHVLRFWATDSWDHREPWDASGWERSTDHVPWLQFAAGCSWL